MPTGEIQTDAIVRDALESGKKVFVPYLYKNLNPPAETPISVMEMVGLSCLDDYESLERDRWGIPTIRTDTVDQRECVLKELTRESGALELILMPGVAFDIDLKTNYVRRLGHGKGFYDYFLHRYKTIHSSQAGESALGPGTDVLLYGLALEEQLLQSEEEPSVPVGEYDNLLHGLVVGDGSLIAGRAKEKGIRE